MKLKLNNNQKFFIEQQIGFSEELYEYGDYETNSFYEEQKRDREKILNRIGKIILIYGIANSYIKINRKNKSIEYNNISKIIDTVFSKQCIRESEKLKKVLFEVSHKKYNYNTYLMAIGSNIKVKNIKDSNIDKIINQNILGKNYKDRIWNNKEDAAKILKKEIKDFLNGNTDVNKIYKVVKNRFNSNAYKTKRLVENEISRVQNRINDAWEKEYNIEYVLYSATLDNRTCGDCSQYDGWVGKVSEKPVTLPQHVKCRCCYVSLPCKDYNPKTRIDNVTKNIIPYVDYKTWKKTS